MSCPPRGPWLPRKWKPKPIIFRETQIDPLNELEHFLENFNRKGHMSPRTKIAMERLYFDRTPVLRGFQVFLGEQRAILYNSGYIKDNSSHKHPLPPPPPEPSPTLPRQPWSPRPIEEQIKLLNLLETCLEDYNREGYPGDRLEEIIGRLTPKAIYGPMGIRKNH